MSTFQIDLDLMRESEKTYKESVKLLEEYIRELDCSINRIGGEDYAGPDAWMLRTLMRWFTSKRVLKSQNTAQKMREKLVLSYEQGQLCKKKCYDFIFALAGGGIARITESFTGVLYCDQEKISGLISTAYDARLLIGSMESTAETVKSMLSGLKKVPTDYDTYANNMINACRKAEQCLQEHTKELTEYAGFVEEMDDEIQTRFRECIMKGYESTADGVDDRQKYLHMEYDEKELERLLSIPENELTADERAKLDILLIKLQQLGDMHKLRELVDRGIIDKNLFDSYTKEYITKDMLISIGWNKENISDEMVMELNRVLEKYEINTPDRIKHFLAQCTFESGYGKYKIEDPTNEYIDKKKYGSKYRGVGYIQMTWDYAYQAFATYLILEEYPELEEFVSYKNPSCNGRDSILQEYEKLKEISDEKGIDITKYTDIVDEGYLYVSENFSWECAGYYWKISGLNEVVDNCTSTDEISRGVNRYDESTFSKREAIYKEICKIINIE